MAESDDEGAKARTGGLIGALVLIAIGLIFLLQNMGYQLPGNWWALFLLIPAFFSFAGAWKTFQRAGGVVTMAVVGPLIGGLVLLALAVVFLFDLDINWGLVLPAILIALGLAALLRWYRRT